MRERTKNGKLIMSIVLLLGLCIILLTKRATVESGNEPEATPIPKGPQVLQNVWLEEATEQKLIVLHDGALHEYRLSSPLTTPLKKCIVDLVVEQGCVTGMTVKQDTIEAKVLRIGEDFIELEGYGCISIEEGSRVYRMYDETEELTWLDVLVGYTTSSFVLSDNKICAALIQKPVAVTSIRVLIQNSSYGGYYHEMLECGSNSRFYISDGLTRTTWYDGEEKVTVTPELVEEYGGRVYLGTEKDDGKLSLYNVKRAIGVPSYRGTLEVAVQNGELLVVNELSLEEYLYGVLPSEMPESFGLEALKAQAVCARSYACNQLLANRYCVYGAHVDDSSSCQVYQNYGENATAEAAVKATFGKIMEQDGKCITAYYFSCSYGHTSDSFDVWGDDAGTLLDGVVQAKEEAVETLAGAGSFESFLDSDREWYDEESAWFRWNTILGAEMEERILTRLKERQKVVPDMILTKTGESEAGMHFEQRTIEKFGKLEEILVAERGDSGIITKLLLVGSEATYLIQKEYNIRYVLAPLNTVYLQDGSTTSNMNLLPSAYFTVEKGNNYFVLRGGGYGHGVGMSQYGAKYMAAEGFGYEEILMHFYKDTELIYLYQ